MDFKKSLKSEFMFIKWCIKKNTILRTGRLYKWANERFLQSQCCLWRVNSLNIPGLCFVIVVHFRCIMLRKKCSWISVRKRITYEMPPLYCVAVYTFECDGQIKNKIVVLKFAISCYAFFIDASVLELHNISIILFETFYFFP